MTERKALLDLLLDVAREREVGGDHAAAQRLRRCAAAISQANDRTLVALGFVRRPFLHVALEKITARAN